MASSVVSKLTCVLLLCMMAAAPLAQAAITCGQITSALAVCVPYLTGKGPLGGCCGGIKSLIAAASTTPDRQQACNCLKSAAGAVPGINYDLASGLPAQCGVRIPYKISASTDCATVK